MTTVNVDCYGIGRQAALKLTQTIQAAAEPPEPITVTGFRVVEREST